MTKRNVVQVCVCVCVCVGGGLFVVAKDNCTSVIYICDNLMYMYNVAWIALPSRPYSQHFNAVDAVK